MTAPYPYRIYRDSYRAECEDHITVVETDAGLVIAVADDVGGRANGGAAAQTAIRQVEEFVAQGTRRGMREWQHFAEQLDHRLAWDEACGETTLVVAELSARQIIGVSVGDSEAWLMVPGGHYDLMARQIAKPFLGSGAAIPVPFRLRHVHPNMPGMIVVASDGLFKYTTAAQIEAMVRNPDLTAAAKAVGTLPRLRAGTLPDDLAVCVCRLEAAPPLRIRWPLAREVEWVPSLPRNEEQ